MERDKGTETKTGTEAGKIERAAEAAPEAEDWRGRYERERAAFARYREEAERLRLREAYRALLAEAGVPAGRREAARELKQPDRSRTAGAWTPTSGWERPGSSPAAPSPHTRP